MQLNTDYSQTVVIETASLSWIPTARSGVHRRMLERDGDELARATTIVRYEPGPSFHAHVHDGGEEFLVLEGVFSDETGDFGPGYYVRNPRGSRHAPFREDGCTILVKLRQFQPDDAQSVRIDTRRSDWQPSPENPGVSKIALHAHGEERVALVRLEPGAAIPAHAHAGGLEIYVTDGVLEDERGVHAADTWLRYPPGARHGVRSRAGCVLWMKTGQLGAAVREA